MKRRELNEVTTISYEDVEELAKYIGEDIYKWIKEHPKATPEVCSDLVQATLEGFICGRVDRRKEEQENLDEYYEGAIDGF